MLNPHWNFKLKNILKELCRSKNGTLQESIISIQFVDLGRRERS